MFDEVCSIYADALDNVGRYVDMETGECIQQMTIREFCLTDRWKPYVEKLRAMREEYGDKAKKMQEYVDTKKQLPGATLSGLFATWDDECIDKNTGEHYIKPVSRRETHLQQHTGWLAIDIDLADNENLSNFDNIRMVCRFRPEIALLMRSCSGTGYFGLVRLAYPERHKEQFKALMKEYAALGITLDKQCSNIGRVRFASWDEPEHIYINERAKAYMGVEAPAALPPSLPYRMRSAYHGGNRASAQDSRAFWDDPQTQDRIVELCVHAMVQRHINIAETYDEWVKVGWALKAHPYGERLFHDLSAQSEKYNPAQTAHKWHQLGQNTTVTYAYLLHEAKQWLGASGLHEIRQRVWRERR